MFESPVSISQTEYKMRIEDLEPFLRPSDSPQLASNPYKPKVVSLRDGSKLVVRQAERKDATKVLQAIKPYFEVEKDFYDLVSVRAYAEVLAWVRNRIKDHYLLLAIRNGELLAIANARLYSDKLVYSLHTLSFERGLGVGPIAYFSKVEYAFDFLGADEWWVTFEGYIGLTVLGLRWAPKIKPWPELQHELSGARVFFLTREDWLRNREKYKAWLGVRPPPADLLKESEDFRLKQTVDV